MAALNNIWTKLTDVNRIDDDTTRLTLTDIGVSLDGSRFEITGVGCTDGDIYEGLQFVATRVDDDNVDIDWATPIDNKGNVYDLLAPDDDWTYGGMVRVYEAPISCADGMRISFNPENIASITSTGSTVEEYKKDNVLNSNRGMTHQLATGDHTIVATLSETALVETVAMLDLTCSLGTTVRIRGAGAVSDVDVVYPAIAPRFALGERPKIGYEGINIGGHNTNDLTPHFVGYVPPMMPTTVTVDIEGSTSAIEFSELIITSNYEPQTAVNFDFGSQVTHSMQGTLSQRGPITSFKYDGRQTEVAFQVRWLDGYDRTYIDLISKSKRTTIVDMYPREHAIRWEAMVAGFVTGTIPITQEQTGGAVELRVTDSKYHPGL